jgi:hypothetical protein
VRATLNFVLSGNMREPSEPGVSALIRPLPPEAEETVGAAHDSFRVVAASATACVVASAAVAVAAAEVEPDVEPAVAPLPDELAAAVDAGEELSPPPPQPARARTSVDRRNGVFFIGSDTWTERRNDAQRRLRASGLFRGGPSPA